VRSVPDDDVHIALQKNYSWPALPAYEWTRPPHELPAPSALQKQWDRMTNVSLLVDLVL
jgi:hypothetical protein